MTRHYILTRFNLGLYKRNKYLRSVRNEAWLEHRFELFEKYCLPSVVAQDSQSFVWLVLFDQDTPEAYKGRVRGYMRAYPFFRPLSVRGEYAAHFVQIYQQAIQKDLQRLKAAGIPVDRVITTCLDNDDALSSDFVSRVEHLYRPLPDASFITFLRGLQYFTELNIATRIKYPQNHFLSFVETPTEDLWVRTVHAYGDHSHLYQYQGVHIHEVDTPEEPAWVEVVHTTNIANDVLMHRGTELEADRAVLQKHFCIDQQLSDRGYTIYCTSFRMRQAREVFRKAFFKALCCLPASVFSNQFAPKREALPRE
ncbi:glycosyltransferase [Porphyromonas sp. COT-239 OH1446]|uniref:glycosyltransferase n=1 Tax=Porphyromonas sp. COT-239 OH1446 TaxID=1515613 RepID=UPI000691FBAE|nr:glycosyltransferase [Porphyromonas sp. COT-239 OH1446]